MQISRGGPWQGFRSMVGGRQGLGVAWPAQPLNRGNPKERVGRPPRYLVQMEDGSCKWVHIGKAQASIL